MQYYNSPKSLYQKDKEKISHIIPKIPFTLESVMMKLPQGKEAKLPLLKPTLGFPMIDIRTLLQQTGYVVFDPGFVATGSCASTITYIDGDKGELLYRGINIKDLAENSTYMEVCYLLIYGFLPSKQELQKFEDTIISEMMVNQKFIEFFKGFKSDAHPMAIMCGVVGALSAFMNQEQMDINDTKQREQISIRIIAKMPTIAAMAFRTAMGLPIVLPSKKYNFIENFLYMMFSNPMEEFKVDPRIIRAMDVIFIVHADHEQNASSSTVRISGSSLTNPYACMATGIASLWGPAHGGANEAVLKMLEEIGKVENVPACILKAKDKTSNFRLMGFGHRVYKNYDPRAKIMQKLCNDVLEAVNQQNNELLKIAKLLEQAALQDEYFIKRKLYPNVDFYTGIIYKAIGIPTSMFTVMFAVARSVGWISQWNEMISENTFKLSRPRQLYTGNKPRVFKKIEEREEVQVSRVPETNKIVSLTNLVNL